MCRLTPGTVINRRISGEPTAASGERPIDLGDLTVEEVDLAQAARNGLALVRRQLDALKEAPAPLAGDVVDAGAVEQVALKRGGDLVLRPAALAHELGPAGDVASQRPGPLVGAPDLGQVAGGQELGQPAGVEAVGLRLGLRDRAQLFRVDDDDARDLRAQDRGDRLRAARRLERDLVV